MLISSSSLPSGISIFASLCVHSSNVALDMIVRYMERRKWTRSASERSLTARVALVEDSAGTTPSPPSSWSLSCSSSPSLSASLPLSVSLSPLSSSSPRPRISFRIDFHSCSVSSNFGSTWARRHNLNDFSAANAIR